MSDTQKSGLHALHALDLHLKWFHLEGCLLPVIKEIQKLILSAFTITFCQINVDCSLGRH